MLPDVLQGAPLSLRFVRAVGPLVLFPFVVCGRVGGVFVRVPFHRILVVLYSNTRPIPEFPSSELVRFPTRFILFLKPLPLLLSLPVQPRLEHLFCHFGFLLDKLPCFLDAVLKCPARDVRQLPFQQLFDPDLRLDLDLDLLLHHLLYLAHLLLGLFLLHALEEKLHLSLGLCSSLLCFRSLLLCSGGTIGLGVRLQAFLHVVDLLLDNFALVLILETKSLVLHILLSFLLPLLLGGLLLVAGSLCFPHLGACVSLCSLLPVTARRDGMGPRLDKKPLSDPPPPMAWIGLDWFGLVWARCPACVPP
mmetsp:Transcript_11379/g.28868  ORF Transcript_11379/g.28868 Transcript_11379/m.28868 type:complete len:306 (-) Transcript_11379:46-963(-)